MRFFCFCLLFLVSRICLSDEIDDRFSEDISEGNLRFLSVYAYAEDTPELNALDFNYCYKLQVGNHAKLNTSDVAPGGITKIGNDILAKNKNITLREYAAKYNQKLIGYLNSQGLNDCLSGERWGKAFDDISKFVWTLTEKGKELSHISAPQQFGEPFKVYLGKLDFYDTFKEKSCSFFRNNGINREIVFNVKVSEYQNKKWAVVKQEMVVCKAVSRNL